LRFIHKVSMASDRPLFSGYKTTAERLDKLEGFNGL